MSVRVSYEGAGLASATQYLKVGAAMKRGTTLFSLTLAGGKPGERKVEVEGLVKSMPLLKRGVLLEPTLDLISATCTEILSEFEQLA